jgi:hypothetical protein
MIHNYNAIFFKLLIEVIVGPIVPQCLITLHTELLPLRYETRSAAAVCNGQRFPCLATSYLSL